MGTEKGEWKTKENAYDFANSCQKALELLREPLETVLSLLVFVCSVRRMTILIKTFTTRSKEWEASYLSTTSPPGKASPDLQAIEDIFKQRSGHHWCPCPGDHG